MITISSEYNANNDLTFIEYDESYKECKNMGNSINEFASCKSYYLLNELMSNGDLYIGIDANTEKYFNNEGLMKDFNKYYAHVNHDKYTSYNCIECAKIESHDKFGIYISFNLNVYEGRLLYNICKHNKVSAIVLTDPHPISSDTIMLKPTGIVLSLGVINDTNLII